MTNRGILRGLGRAVADDGSVLTADASQSDGQKWQLPADYPLVGPGGYTSLGPGLNNNTPAESTLYSYRMSNMLAADGIITIVGFHITGTAGTAGCVVRLGLYADNGAGKPGALVADFGTGSAVSPASNVTIATSQPVKARTRYWWAGVMQGAAATRAIWYNHNPDPAMLSWVMLGAQTVNNVGDVISGGTSQIPACWVQTGVTGALPTTFASTGTGMPGTAPRITFKVV